VGNEKRGRQKVHPLDSIYFGALGARGEKTRKQCSPTGKKSSKIRREGTGLILVEKRKTGVLTGKARKKLRKRVKKKGSLALKRRSQKKNEGEKVNR